MLEFNLKKKQARKELYYEKNNFVAELGIELINKKNGIAIVLSDHGNSEKMINDDGSPHTAHTTNLVPIAITDKKLKIMGGSLCDVAPTILKLMNIKKPKSMTGKSLI